MQQAPGQVNSVIGNHDLQLLAAYKLGRHTERIREGETVDADETDFFTADWLTSGGQHGDLARLDPARAQWLAERPAILSDEKHLVMHADGMFYMHYGTSVQMVNAAFREIIAGDDHDSWRILLDAFGEHRAFLDDHANSRRFLRTFGGSQIIHGHTPVPKVIDRPPEEVTTPHIYGRCVNVDGGIYLGGPGFLYQPPAL
jgi:hypothetical protein